MIVDLFAGPGGWDQGLALLGRRDVVGFEWDKAACRTARAAGHQRRQCDVADLDYESLRREFVVEGLIASPPCQAWSKAGDRLGLLDQERIFEHLERVEAAGEWIDYRDRSEAVVDLFGVADVDWSGWNDPRSALVLEPVRAVLALRPRWIACEQVPDVLPFWQAFARFLERLGYSTWCGVMSAEQYGVPQTRKRAILLASKARPVSAPPATHRPYRKGTPRSEGDPALLPWVSMADALGWGPGAVGFPRRDDRGGDGYRDRDFRDVGDPSFVLTEKVRSWQRFPGLAYVNGNQPNSAVRPVDEPAPTVHFGHRLNEVRWQARDSGPGAEREPREVEEDPSFTIRANGSGKHPSGVRWGLRASVSDEGSAKSPPRELDEPAHTVTGKHRSAEWTQERPATTVQGDSRIWPPGHKVNAADVARLGAEEAGERYGDRAGTGSVRVTTAEAAVLQSFPADYPWWGSNTERFRQVGDAVPPLLAVAAVGHLTGVAGWQDVCRRSGRETLSGTG